MAQTVIEFIISPILVALLGYIVWLLQQARKTSKKNDEGVMLLLQDRIIRAHEKFCLKGEPMTTTDYRIISRVHATYKALGEDGEIDRYWSDLKSVDIVKGE